jgi:hypothetical protein
MNKNAMNIYQLYNYPSTNNMLNIVPNNQRNIASIPVLLNHKTLASAKQDHNSVRKVKDSNSDKSLSRSQNISHNSGIQEENSTNLNIAPYHLNLIKYPPSDEENPINIAKVLPRNKSKRHHKEESPPAYSPNFKSKFERVASCKKVNDKKEFLYDIKARKNNKKVPFKI